MRGIHFHERFRSRQLRSAQTKAEEYLWGALRSRRLCGYKFVRQQPIGPFFVDFACREQSLIVEIDDATHSTNEEIARDAARERFLREQGYRVLRFANDEVYRNINGVCETILAALERRETP
jgi:very-short-patch-repair endonuclease